ncbi:hypothetical protein BDF14DRAFT_1341856 [Spinellus fusiger]|nr:hypothetical protein BDF14DRAFT_1341856 [Spinellus fusiger]
MQMGFSTWSILYIGRFSTTVCMAIPTHTTSKVGSVTGAWTVAVTLLSYEQWSFFFFRCAVHPSSVLVVTAVAAVAGCEQVRKHCNSRKGRRAEGHGKDGMLLIE